MDGYLGCNQALVSEPDIFKTTFHTKWSTFSFQRMAFGLINLSARFKRAMDITFRGLISQSIVVYLDDVTMVSKKRSNHICHLRKCFERCRKYVIYLNPKKSIFVVSEGNLLGHIIAKSGIKLELKRVNSITQISL